MRTIRVTYQDPLDLIWIQAARSLGVIVERNPDVFASWDGAGVLRIGTAETLDADDSLAQMILHELCHLLVEGPEAIQLPDWGLENDPSKVAHEHAA
ncbi:MAG: YkgJ family cysteine cluster protein, partial [Planctomycetota bacterium]